MKKLTEEIRRKAKELLASGTVQYVLGYEAARNAYEPRPVFIRRPEDVDRLVWNPFCANTLAKYLFEDRYKEGKIGIIAKGCDSRGIVRLINDGQITREQVYIIGVPCTGLLDPAKLPPVPDGVPVEVEDQGESFSLALPGGAQVVAKAEAMPAKCQNCDYPNPVISDVIIGKEVQPRQVTPQARYAEVIELEAYKPEAKKAYWESVFDRCIRCYACRNVCPACDCKECVFDQAEPRWVSKAINVPENRIFHITRALHVAGRCVECGECDRICPMHIPIRKLNKKIAKDLGELFGEQRPGTQLEEKPALGFYAVNDPEEFM